MSLPRRLIASLLVLFASAGLSLPAAAIDTAQMEDQYRAWSGVVDALERAGYRAVESIELEPFGRFDIEAIDGQGAEHELRLDRDGRVLSSLPDGTFEEQDETLELSAVRGALGWLREQGYHDLEEISADDGAIEIEARGPDGRLRELLLDPATLRLLRTDAPVRMP